MILLLSILFLLPVQQVAEDSSRVVVYPARTELRINNTQKLTIVQAVYDVGDRKLANAEVRWFSADQAVATVTAEGDVTAIAPGETSIAATVDGTTGFATIVVPQLPPARLEITLPEGGVMEGTGAPLWVDVRTRLGDKLDDIPVTFSSSNHDIIAVDATGRIIGHREGTARVTARAGSVTSFVDVRVVDNPAASFEIVGPLEGARTGDVIRFHVRGLTVAGEPVRGFMPAWSVQGWGAQIESDGEEGAFVAESPGRYVITAVVGPSITRSTIVNVTERVHTQELVKVGRGPIATHHSGDTWVFEGVDGRDYAYVGTFMHDWAKVFDVTDPTAPVLTDSIQVDARRINDVKIHPNNRLGLITREGASTRKNGIVFLDLSDPAHPTILSEYTETVTGGVHNVWILGDEELVYAVHNGTRDVHIIDIADPRKPKEVGRWGLKKESKTLHDVIIQDGYAYVSYWDDGVVTLDAGAGSHGGTARQPVFVSQYKYPIGNTHVAWRHGKYLFVGDEIFPPDWDADLPIEATGYVHVLDMTDIENPVEVARYEVPEAGAHNLWSDDDKLYVGYYQGGLRVVDISGELQGDLYRQGREISVLKTTDRNTTVPNWPMTWGAQLFKGHIYTSDLNSGLWIAKLTDAGLAP